MNDVDVLLNIIQTSETTLKDIALSLDGDRCISQPMEDNSFNYHTFDLNPDRFIWYDNKMINNPSWDAFEENKLAVYRSLAGRSNLLRFVKSLDRDLHYPMGAPFANFTGITQFQTRIRDFDDEPEVDELDLDAELDHYYWLLKNTRFDKLTSIRLMTDNPGSRVITFIWRHPLRTLCHELGISLCYHEESRWDSEPIPFTSVEPSLL
jgi:hypothetical protein